MPSFHYRSPPGHRLFDELPPGTRIHRMFESIFGTTKDEKHDYGRTHHTVNVPTSRTVKSP